MKCLPLVTVLVALAIVPVTSAQNERREKQAARKNAAAARFTQRAAQQPRAVAPRQNRSIQNRAIRNRSNFNAGAASSFRRSSGRASAAYNHDLSIRPRVGRPAISRNKTRFTSPAVTPNITPLRPRTEFENGSRRGGNRTGVGRNRTWRDRGDGTRVWSGNNQAGDWRNRSGNDRQRWSGRRGGYRHDWSRRHRHRSWWLSNFTRFALFGGGYYYWDSGYWYPAYGYDPYFSTYTYDAPIYGYNNLEPGEVIAQVQVELQRRGYDPGAVDGDFGPATRQALLDFQRDNGLPVTGEIDEATLETLGLE